MLSGSWVQQVPQKWLHKLHKFLFFWGSRRYLFFWTCINYNQLQANLRLKRLLLHYPVNSEVYKIWYTYCRPFTPSFPGLSIDIHDEPCCKFDTQYGCVCCPTTPALLETTFSSFITVLEMYVNTKFILYLGDIAKDPADTADTYQFFRWDCKTTHEDQLEVFQ